MTNLLKINRPLGYNLNDLEYVEFYVKGKNKKHTVFDYRPLFREIGTGREYLLMLHDLNYRNSSMFHYGNELSFHPNFNKKGNTTLKNGTYNYYLDKTKGFNEINELFKTWKQSNPLIHAGGMIHKNLNEILKSNSHVYEFNNIKY